MNPWKLTAAQARILDLIVAGNCDKQVARLTNATPSAIRSAFLRIRGKMGAANRVAAAVQWDRFTRPSA